MSDLQLRYVLGSAQYANADNLTGNLKISLPSTNKLIPEDQVVELVSLATRYNKERQLSSTHRIYGRLSFITTNELTNFNPVTLSLIEPTTQVNNYNLQLLYPSSHISDVTLSDFSYDLFPLSCSYYSSVNDCSNHKIYHGLPFIKSNVVKYNGRLTTSIKTYNHKYGNNVNPGDYVYIIPGIGGTLNPLYGITKVNNNFLSDGTQNYLVIDKNVSGDFGGSYKKITNPSDNDIQFQNTIDSQVYLTASTSNELFIRTSEQHNVIVGDYIDLRQSGTTYNCYNGIHKVSRVITGFVYACDVPKHIHQQPQSIYVPSVGNMTPTTYNYKYRVLDGIPSEYYLRKFKVITAGDNTTTINNIEFSIQQLHLSNTVWKNVTPSSNLNCNTVKQSGSDDDRITSYVFNVDVNSSNYRDNLGRPLTELYLGVIKRKNVTEFNNMTTNFQGGLMYSGITTYYRPLNLPSYTNPNSKTLINYFGIQQFNDAGLNVGLEYYGDLCEYSVETLQEVILDPLQFRIGKMSYHLHTEGYVYEPFKKIQIRHLSNDIEDVSNTENVIPDYAIPYHTTYRWREILPYGFKEITSTGVNTVDNPFVNGAHYDFNETSFYLRRQNKNPEFKITITSYDASC